MQNTKQKIGDLGQHWTSDEIVDLMLSLRKNKGTILEPSAGAGRFVSKLNNCVAIEIDPAVIPFELKKYYIVSNFFDYDTVNKFDTEIGNPPYVAGNLLNSSWFGTWKGKSPRTANAYLHFIEKAIEHLNENGELIFIVPATFLTETSRGNFLRQRMLSEGSFTDVLYNHEANWEKAAIETIIFRWQKGLKQNTINVDGKEIRFHTQNGFIWLPEFEPVSTIGEYFKSGVGSAPFKSDVENGDDSTNADLYMREGQLVKVCESNKHLWPRIRETKKEDKVFFVNGPIRRWPVFFHGNSSKHLDMVLMPKQQMDVEKVASLLNDWFKRHAVNLKLNKGGRWSVGIKQIETCPIDEELNNNLISCLKNQKSVIHF